MADEIGVNQNGLGGELSRRLGHPENIPEDLGRRIHTRLVADLRPVKPLPAVWICFFGLWGALAILASTLISIMGTAGLGRMSGLQLAAMVTLFVTGSLLFAFLLTSQLAPALAQPFAASVAVWFFGFVAVAGTILLFPWQQPGTTWNLSWQCLLRVLTVALLASLILAVPMRRAAILSPVVKGAALGAAAGLTGVVVLQFACIYQQASHLLLWHWSGMVLATGAGALLGRLRGRISIHS